MLLTEPPRNPAENRLKLAEIMFEGLQVPAGYAMVAWLACRLQAVA